MCNPRPVGSPRLIDSNSYTDSFFGFVDCTVKSPIDEYIGLLSVKWQGKLVCPAGTFRGLFFSEELKFALDNGYKLITIHHLYYFQRGDNCFLDLIEKLNDMKVEAQLNNQPTIRNIAKLLMNSMYGRFGMHTEAIQSAIINPRQLDKYSLTFKILSQIDFGKFLLIHYSLKAPDQLGESPNYKLIREFSRGIPSRTNVAIASAVTAYSRMIINQYKLDALNLGLNLYYSDSS